LRQIRSLLKQVTQCSYPLVTNRSGVTAIEYALIAALIAIAAIAAFQLIGSSISTEFSAIANSV